MYSKHMNRIFLLLVTIVVSGCTALPRQPVDVKLIPNDCANQHAILAWLDKSVKTPKSTLQSKENYDSEVRSIKTRIWDFRYHCNRVR